MQLPAYRQAALSLMLTEQRATLTMPAGSDLNAYAHQLLERFSNPSLRHRTAQIVSDGSQKLPQRMLDSLRYHLHHGSDCRHLLLGIAGWMRYILGEDEKGERYPVADPLVAKFERINQQFPSGPARVQALLGINEIFADDLPANPAFVAALQHTYDRLCQQGARAAVASLNPEAK